MQTTDDETVKRITKFVKLVSNPKYELRENIQHDLNGKSHLLRYAVFKKGELVQGIGQDTYSKNEEWLEEEIARRRLERKNYRPLRGWHVLVSVVIFQIGFVLLGLYYASQCNIFVCNSSESGIFAFMVYLVGTFAGIGGIDIVERKRQGEYISLCLISCIIGIIVVSNAFLAAAPFFP
ncbi:MAG: hypothetical protein JRN15_12415 [Nitrososphaerota archaeon]|nr:hypothetical protein [Nitrososphaerota archaeon]